MKTTLALLLIALPAFASDLRLAWDASPDASVTGYRLYYGPASVVGSFAPTNNVNVGTNLTATISNLATGRWSFAATAYNSSGIESDFSNVVTVEAGAAPRNMRTVVVQYSGTLTNFYDVGYFRLRLP